MQKQTQKVRYTETDQNEDGVGGQIKSLQIQSRGDIERREEERKKETKTERKKGKYEERKNRKEERKKIKKDIFTWIVFQLFPNTQETHEQYTAVPIVKQLRQEVQVAHKGCGVK